MREFSFLTVARNVSIPGIFYMMKALFQTNSADFFPPTSPCHPKRNSLFFFSFVSVNHNPHSQGKKKSLLFSHHCFSKFILQNTMTVNRFSLLQRTRCRANSKLKASKNRAPSIQSAFPTLSFTLGTPVPLLIL